MQSKPDVTITVAGESLRLLPERAIFWPAAATVMIADLHLGKAATFRAASIAVPDGADLARLSRVIAGCDARRLIILGDLLHARSSRTAAALAEMHAWRESHSNLDIVLVRGNHDSHAGDPPEEWGFACVDEPWQAGPFAMRHIPAEDSDGYTLAGHLHPAARLAGAGRQRLTLRCFWMGARVGVLPAFGEFTGSQTIAPAPGDRVYVIAGDEVVAV